MQFCRSNQLRTGTSGNVTVVRGGCFWLPCTWKLLSSKKTWQKKRVRVPSTSCSTTLHKSEGGFSYSLFSYFRGCCFFLLFFKLSLTGNRVCCHFPLFFTMFSVTRQTLWAPAKSNRVKREKISYVLLVVNLFLSELVYVASQGKF